MIGSLTFDHNWQALFFLGCGFILAEILSAKQSMVVSHRRCGGRNRGRSLLATAA